MFRPKTNCSQAYVFKMLTLSKNIAVILDWSAKGYHDLVELAQFVLSVLATAQNREPQFSSFSKMKPLHPLNCVADTKFFGHWKSL